MSEPKILTANTFYWTPARNANGRRYNESRNQTDVYNYFKELGMEVAQNGDTVTGTLNGLVAEFAYSESCSNVYKTLKVTKDGKRSNITALRKLA